MSRYAAMFDRCRAADEGALGGFLMLGDPGLNESLAAVDALVAGGVDFLELGMPFSDPVADGPIIQAAAQRALLAGVRTGDCIALIGQIRARHPQIPIGILTYANIAIARGFAAFCRDLADAGVDSLLVADIPALEAAPYSHAARSEGLEWVMMAARNTLPATLSNLAEYSSGFTYCLARAGTTGTETTSFCHRDLFERLAAVGAPPPILGFGISSPQAVAAAVGEGAAGAICGSAIVERLADGSPDGDFSAFIAALKDATRHPSRSTAHTVEILP